LLGIAKYLPEFGWQPVILSAPLDEKADNRFTIIETGYRDALGFWGKLFKINPNEDPRKQIKNRLGVKTKKSLLDSVMTLAGEIINYPDSEKGWKKRAVNAGGKVLGRGKFDAIISSSAPITAHVIARNLKSRFKLPWVADLRDLWTQNHNYYYGRLRKRIDRRLELKTLGSTDAIVTVSQPWAEKLRMLHTGKQVFAIVNGFDPQRINIPPAKLTKHFTITYTGLIYPGKEDPTPLFSALKDLIAEKIVDPARLEIRFFGPREDWLQKEAEQYGIADVVHQYGEVPRNTAIEKQRESQVLLLLNWDDPDEKGTIPGKIFEYMAALRPTLALGGADDDIIQQILSETKTGFHGTGTEVKDWLKQRYLKYLASGAASGTGSEESIKKYSQREMAGKFAEILDKLTTQKKD
jgi:glycosyltransferase involved in cell wall biosynthesis